MLLLVEQRGLCGICGQVLSENDPTQWEVDEIMPRSMGGGEERWNLQVTHERCRIRMADSCRWITGGAMVEVGQVVTVRPPPRFRVEDFEE